MTARPEVPNRVLLVSANQLGDCVAFLPVAAAVRRHCPASHITMIARRVGAEVTQLTETVDEFIILPRRQEGTRWARAGDFCHLARALRKEPFDLALVASGESSTAAALLFLGGVRTRVGFEDCRLRRLLSVRVKAQDIELEARRNVRLLPAAGLPEELLRPPCRIPTSRRAEARALLQKAGAIAGRHAIIHPGSSTPSRRWPARNFAEICSRLIRSGLAQPVLIEGPAELGLGEEIRRLMAQSAPVLSGLGGVDLLAAVMAECDLFVGHSSGPLHVAFLLGLRSVSLWGDTNPKIWGPAWEEDRHVILLSPLPCAGCERWDPKRHVVIRGQTAGGSAGRLPCEKCMEGISVDEVFEAISRQLAAP